MSLQIFNDSSFKQVMYSLREPQIARNALRAFVATILGILLLAVATQAGFGLPNLRHSQSRKRALVLNHTVAAAEKDNAGSTRMFIIETEADARKLASVHATRNSELMFTTYQFTHKGSYSYEAVHMAEHMWENLREVHGLSNAIMISYDLHSCQVMWEHGIPCFLDRWLPQPSELPGPYGTETPHWYQKYAWALKFIEFGYTALFFELDMIFFENPLPFHNPHNDMEGLSDWPVAELGGPKERFMEPCAVYHMQKGENNDNYLDWGRHRPEDQGSTYHINPCMSTGFWFVQPTQPSRDFLAAFIDLELHWRDWQTDQRLWNEVLMAFLIGHGRQRPLHFSLLDTSLFCNFGEYDGRTKTGHERQPVMLHGGGMMGGEKEPYMRSQGYWKAEAWNSTSAAEHIAALSRHFTRKLPSFGRDHLD